MRSLNRKGAVRVLCVLGGILIIYAMLMGRGEIEVSHRQSGGMDEVVQRLLCIK